MSPFVWSLLACGGEAPPPPRAPPSNPPPVAPSAPGAATLPPDGKYEHVTVDGVPVPMVHLMDGGTVLLVDTDGAKPRTWEEQYKRKGDVGPGWFTVHKTDANRDGAFEDDAIDREGRWRLDERANLSRP